MRLPSSQPCSSWICKRISVLLCVYPKYRSLSTLLTTLQNGSLAVPGGRDLAPVVNSLLSLPYSLKVATKDFHPSDHVSFDTSHTPPNNKPFESSATMTNPYNLLETKQTIIWPVHCVQGTDGAEIIPEIDFSKIDHVVEKGRDKRVEMYSGFADAFGNKSNAASLDLAALLKDAGITHVYAVGLAGDCCVKWTAVDAKKEGFEVYVIEEGTKSIDFGENGWTAAKNELQENGVHVISIEGPEVEKVRQLT